MAIPVAHFFHPQHELKLKTSYHLPRFCDLCGDKLAGRGYSCHRLLCDFDLHEECAKYPETLRSFFAHPWHDLTLARTGDDDARRRVCCGLFFEKVPAGVFLYRCAPCGFAVHPRCSRLPQTARSELHPDHRLTACLPRHAGTCAACREPCSVWVYRCRLCDVDFHIECLHSARPPSPSPSPSPAGAAAAGRRRRRQRRRRRRRRRRLRNKLMEALVEIIGGSLAEVAAEILLNMFKI